MLSAGTETVEHVAEFNIYIFIYFRHSIMNTSPYNNKIKYLTVKSIKMCSCTIFRNKNKIKRILTTQPNTNICTHGKCKVDPVGIGPVLEQLRWHTAHLIYGAYADFNQCWDMGDSGNSRQSYTILTHIFLEASSLPIKPVLSFVISS